MQGQSSWTPRITYLYGLCIILWRSKGRYRVFSARERHGTAVSSRRWRGVSFDWSTTCQPIVQWLPRLCTLYRNAFSVRSRWPCGRVFGLVLRLVHRTAVLEGLTSLVRLQHAVITCRIESPDHLLWLIVMPARSNSLYGVARPTYIRIQRMPEPTW